MHQGVVGRAQVSRLEPHLPGLRAELEEQREFRLEQLEELGSAIETFEDEARLEVAYVLAMAAGSALEEIEAALTLAAGAYGACVGCAGPVGLQRLEVLPMAALCASCQYLAEPVWSASAAAADLPFAAGIRSDDRGAADCLDGDHRHAAGVRHLRSPYGRTDDSTRAAISSVITARFAAAESTARRESSYLVAFESSSVIAARLDAAESLRNLSRRRDSSP